jgi:hypothetical protein
MARLSVLAAEDAVVRRLERVVTELGHRCTARATLSRPDAIAGLFARWLVDPSIDAIVAVATAATRGVVEANAQGAKLVVLVEDADAARAALAELALAKEPQPLPAAAVRHAAVPTNRTIQLGDDDLAFKPRSPKMPSSTSQTIQLGDDDIEPQPSPSPTSQTIQLDAGDLEPHQLPTNMTIQLGDGDVEAEQPARAAPNRSWRWPVVAIAIVGATAAALHYC